jgi:hypothetical protein
MSNNEQIRSENHTQSRDNVPAMDRTPRRLRIKPVILALRMFVRSVLFAPIVLLRGRHRSESVVVYSVHPSFYLWAPIAFGFILAAIVRHFPQYTVAAGWTFVWIALYFTMALLYDFNARRLTLWIGIVALLWLASKYVEHVRNVAVLGYVMNYLASLSPRLDPGVSSVLSWLLLPAWLGAMCDMVLNRRKRFTPNEIGEYHFGDGSELTDRTGLRFRTQYRDVLETILTFGGGDLLAVDNHQHVIKRWDNIIGLYFVWKDLDRILHQRAVTDEAPEEVESGN